MRLFARDSCLVLSNTKVMGILNVTPDSFSDGGKYNSLSSALLQVKNMINAGANIIDVGGKSTRPGAVNISIEEELERVIPVIEAITKNFDIWISIDTSRTEVMKESLRAGAHIINDIHSLSEDGAVELAAMNNYPVCLTHNPIILSSYKSSKHENIIDVVNIYFSKKIAYYEKSGIKKNNIILDPGFGFGKSLLHNYQLLANLKKFHHFGLPLLIGVSRKSMIGNLLKIINPTDRLVGSISCAVIALMQDIQIIRVHDVKETLEAINIVNTVQKMKECSYG
ncbi:dihydropteroate synthase [Candidatus Pantoea edessiphila]|uniref:Dihydropteroate synthase n=1 Tax=Candidatus Pantoea edessiphila TaxID=2044610 RepID=A0A2P5T215_9GAMM|nr:dihydropteroate synthase [Candidatus Pantoea edessiphila]PPI88606.1 dihydropteroate synthase [Candidatus Pantoea edessiphila]